MQLYQVWVLAAAIFSRCVDILFILGCSAMQENFVPYYVIKFPQIIHSNVRNISIQYYNGTFNFILYFIKIYNRPNLFSKRPFCIKTCVNME